MCRSGTLLPQHVARLHSAIMATLEIARELREAVREVRVVPVGDVVARLCLAQRIGMPHIAQGMKAVGQPMMAKSRHHTRARDHNSKTWAPTLSADFCWPMLEIVPTLGVVQLYFAYNVHHRPSN